MLFMIMDSMFWTATAVMLVFVIFRLMEGKLTSKEAHPTKDIIKDSVVVYLSALGALFILQQLGKSGGGGAKMATAQVSTTEPGF